MIPKPAIFLPLLLALSMAANIYFAAQLGGVDKLGTEVGALKISNARLATENAKAAATINTLLAEAERWEAYRTELEGYILP